MKIMIIRCDMCGKEERQKAGEFETMDSFGMRIMQGASEMGVGPRIEHCCTECAAAILEKMDQISEWIEHSAKQAAATLERRP